MSAPELSRRGLLATLAAAGAAVSGRALAGSEAPPVAAPVAADDPGLVLGGPATPTAARSPFEPAMALHPTGQVTGPSHAPIQEFYGSITPTDLQFQRHHAGVPTIDPARHRLLVHGLVDRPTVFTMAELKRFPTVSRIAFIECSGNGRSAFRAPKPDVTAQKIAGLTSNLEWTGVRLADVLREAGVRPEATWLFAEGADAAHLSRSVTLEAVRDEALLVFAANGEALRPAHGYPLRLLLPGMEANMSIKWLRRLELRTEPVYSRDETAKYTDPLADGTIRKFSWHVDCNSVITSPSHPDVLTGPGWWPITGLAWSGRGKITRVEVSSDGGASWSDAELLGPALPKAHVRFRHQWRWEGGEAVLVSRATDETGYVQPTMAEFARVRGHGTDYHFNFQKAWRVGADGAVFFRPEPEAAP